MKKKDKANIKYLSYKLITVTIVLVFFALFLICLISYNEFDPSPFSIGEESATNKLGIFGAYISSILIFVYGYTVWLILLGLLLLSSLIIRTKDFINLLFLRIIVIFFSTFMISISISILDIKNGILAKVLLAKISRDLGSFYTDYNYYILLSNLFLFLIFYFTSVSKNLESFLIFIFTLLRLFFRNFYILFSLLLRMKFRKKKYL